MKKILVTGAAGFIGSNLVDKLLSNGYFVVGLDNFDPYYDPKKKKKNLSGALKNKNFVLIEGDILDRKLLDKVFLKYSPTCVVHLAAKVGVRNSLINPVEYSQVIILGTLSLLEAIRNNPVSSFIFASSSSVYGDSQLFPFKENESPGIPLSPYAFSKRSAELLCQQYASLYRIPITILRLFSVYGPNQRPDLAISKFIKNIGSGKNIEIYGNGGQTRDFTYIDDIVKGFLLTLDRSSTFDIFNLGSSRPVSVNQILSILGKLMDKEIHKTYLPSNKFEMSRTHADIIKAQKLLYWHPEIGIEDGLRRSIRKLE